MVHVNFINLLNKIKYRLKLNSLVAFHQLMRLSDKNLPMRLIADFLQTGQWLLPKVSRLQATVLLKNKVLLVCGMPICLHLFMAVFSL